MSLLLNIIWFVLGGFIVFFLYVAGAILLCLTIIGIPFGIACFKLAGLAAMPFGKTIREKEPPGGIPTIILNIIWILLPGLELAIIHLVLAAISAITIIGLPFAAQHLKLTRMALLPFGYYSTPRD
jgi:uncharacterized membrane protein YccF (DUF307 family)